MKDINNKWFTFVELIVVLVILTILATIGFIAYQSYLEAGRDTNRIVQLNDINDGLELLSVSSKLPFPEDMIELTASGSIFAYQGYAGKSVIDAIAYDGWGLDPEHNEYFTYMLDASGRDFQLMTFLTNPDYLSQKIVSQWYAAVDYESLYPKVVGKPLGIMVDLVTQAPLHLIEDVSNLWSYDIVTGTESIRSYYSDTQSISSNVDSLLQIVWTQSCKRILELGRSKWSGNYTIAPTWSVKTRVYCDMETDGGGWTLVARSKLGAGYTNFGWLQKRWNVSDLSDAYSLGDISKDVHFEDILYTTDDGIKWIQTNFDSDILATESGAEVTTSKNKRVLENPDDASPIPSYSSWGRIDVNQSYSFNTDTWDGCSQANQRCSGMTARWYAGRNNEGVRGKAGEIFIR